jgi:hypothetical protein
MLNLKDSIRKSLSHDLNEMKKITNSLISPIGNANQRMRKHGPLNISEVGSDAMEE